jgi:hypothetical protein
MVLQKKYRLQALLNVKDRVKKRASMFLAKSIKTLNEEREKEEKLIEEKKKIIEEQIECQREMKQNMETGGRVRKGNVHLNFLRKLKDDEEEKEKEIEAQKEVVEEAAEQVSKARREYIDACKEFQVMEKHKELWEKKIKEEMSRREEREFDELSHAVHQIKQWSKDVEDAKGVN